MTSQAYLELFGEGAGEPYSDGDPEGDRRREKAEVRQHQQWWGLYRETEPIEKKKIYIYIWIWPYMWRERDLSQRFGSKLTS